MKFGNIPDFILSTELRSTDEQYITLKELIKDSTDQDIIDVKYVATPIEGADNKFNLETFVAYTKDHVLTLSFVYPVGFYMARLNRHYAK